VPMRIFGEETWGRIGAVDSMDGNRRRRAGKE
jgi:hypothetical protein